MTVKKPGHHVVSRAIFALQPIKIGGFEFQANQDWRV
jgi:hypothetical protein